MDQTNLNETENKQVQSPERALVEIPNHLNAHFSVERWNLLTYEQRDMLINIEKLPEQLFGIVPESVWETLSVAQKLEFIYTHELLSRPEDMAAAERRELNEEEEFSQFRHQVEGEQVGTSGESADTLDQGDENLSSQFESMKEEISIIENESFPQEPEQTQTEEDQYLPPDDVESIQSSSGSTFAQNPMPRLAGYEPDESFMSTVEERVNGDPKNSGTWAANIIEKFWNTFRSSE